MGLESLTGSSVYIDDLVATNPVGGTDPKSEGDDHIRGIKKVLLNTMPNITGAITSTQAELNILDGVTSTAAELNILDGVTATATELNYNDITTLGTTEASKVVTTDGSNNFSTAGNVSITGAFTSLGIDDNASSNAVTIDVDEQVFHIKNSSGLASKGQEFRSSGAHWITADAVTPQQINRTTDTGKMIEFFKDEVSVGDITWSGVTLALNSTSDYRLKENDIALSNSIERLSKLNPIKYNFIGNDTVIDGFFAHNVQEVVPEAVQGEKDGVDYQTMDQTKLIPLIVSALQEEIKLRKKLESRIANIENK